MGISEEKIDKEQLIEDLHFLSDRGNYKSIKYAIECIDKLAKIEQIINTEVERGDCVLHCELTRKIREVLENE